MRNKVILVMALIFGLLAAFLVYTYLNNVNKSAEKRLYTQVVTATQDIPANTAITNVMVEMKPFPNDLLNGKEIVDINSVVGKISSVALTKGEVLLDNHLVKPGESTDRLSYVIPTGMRAMSIPVNEVSGVANMIKRGDRVDVVAIVPTSTQTAIPTSVVVLQNLDVLAVGTTLNSGMTPTDKAAPATITVAVDPESALKLKLALSVTNFSITLRPAGDQNITNTVPVSVNQF